MEDNKVCCWSTPDGTNRMLASKLEPYTNLRPGLRTYRCYLLAEKREIWQPAQLRVVDIIPKGDIWIYACDFNAKTHLRRRNYRIETSIGVEKFSAMDERRSRPVSKLEIEFVLDYGKPRYLTLCDDPRSWQLTWHWLYRLASTAMRSGRGGLRTNVPLPCRVFE